MHILVVTDQHAQSLGGVQVSLRLQRKFLARLGHRMTIVAPTLHRAHERNPDDIDLPSWSITKDKEYGVSWPGRRSDRFILRALDALPPVDLVHVQGDFWGAIIGYRVARLLDVPVVHTMHNNVDHGTRAVSRLAPIAFWGLNVWRRMMLGPTRSRQRGAWRYLASLAERATVVVAPSAHFARELQQHDVASSVVPEVFVIPTGVDDDVLDAVLAAIGGDGAGDDRRTHPTLVWLGRMSHEKRIMQFLEAVAQADVDVRVELYGAGLLADQVAQFIAERGLTEKVMQQGPVSYEQALAAIARADALVQTSVGFETQGMTVFEAAALGTPSILSDPNIADDLGSDVGWRVADTSLAALAEAIRTAVAELRERPVRVPAVEAASHRQSVLVDRMLAVYEAALGGHSLPE